jgi:acyl-Coa thioesterase superfamily protein/acyl-CoA thioesterase superfamily protein
VPESFYETDGDRYLSTELTRGPWDPGAQHAGPPAALLGRELEGLEDSDAFQVGRLSFEIMRSVPIAPLRAEARIVRPGRRVQLIEGSLSDSDGEVMRVRGWRLRTEALELPPLPTPEPPPPLEEAEARDFPPTGQAVGYHTAMDYRFVSGAFREPGPATVWMRMRQPLVADEEPSPLQRVLAAADSGNGISATLDWTKFLFINVDLSVHMERMPEGEWICLDSVTYPQPNGVGLADTLLLDERGRIGRALQTLLIAARD